MKMWGVFHAGVDKWICSLNDKLRASKSQHVLCSDISGKGRGHGEKGSPLHRN
jgi:hypothetical protein